MKTKLPTEWQELSDQLGFQEFTPIQTQLFEPLLAGENLLGVSPTGTGKTLAYLLPSLLRLQKKKAQPYHKIMVRKKCITFLLNS